MEAKHMKRTSNLIALMMMGLLMMGTVAAAGNNLYSQPQKGSIGGKFKKASGKGKGGGGDKSGATGKSLKLGGPRFESGGRKKKNSWPKPKM
jgi:hypothetical protein